MSKFEKEEGEMSDESLMDIGETIFDDTKDFTLLYSTNKSGLIVKKVDASKLKERATRFGLSLLGRKAITQQQIDELYEQFNIKDGLERHIRFDTLHLRGVSGFSTKDIFEYLNDYKPVSLEWVDLHSCNVVCQDHISTALAILVHSKEIDEEAVREIALSTPPYTWRHAIPHPNSDIILIRFANKSDKKDLSKSIVESKMGDDLRSQITKSNLENKISGKNPWGDLCRSWGVNDHQEIYGPKLSYKKSCIVTDDGIKTKSFLHASVDKMKKEFKIGKSLAARLGKRSYSYDSSSDDEVWVKKNKFPRMRMRADDEETRFNKEIEKEETSPQEDVNQTTSIYVEVENDQIHSYVRPRLDAKLNESKDKTPVHARLGIRCNVENDDSFEDSEQFDSESSNEDSQSRQRVMSSVWHRLDSNLSTKNKEKDLRNDLQKKSKPFAKVTDLRSRLKEKDVRGRSPLRIEIDNEYYN